jgi:hypothetical protein
MITFNGGIMYYLEDLNLSDIKFLNQLLENYRKENMTEENPKKPLQKDYHILRAKVKRLVKFASYNPFETDTPKQQSKFSEYKKFHKKNYKIKEKKTMRKQHMIQPNRITKNPALIIDTDYYRNEYGNGTEKPSDIGTKPIPKFLQKENAVIVNKREKIQ